MDFSLDNLVDLIDGHGRFRDLINCFCEQISELHKRMPIASQMASKRQFTGLDLCFGMRKTMWIDDLMSTLWLNSIKCLRIALWFVFLVCALLKQSEWCPRNLSDNCVVVRPWNISSSTRYSIGPTYCPNLNYDWFILSLILYNTGPTKQCSIFTLWDLYLYAAVGSR